MKVTFYVEIVVNIFYKYKMNKTTIKYANNFLFNKILCNLLIHLLKHVSNEIYVFKSWNKYQDFP